MLKTNLCMEDLSIRVLFRKCYFPYGRDLRVLPFDEREDLVSSY